MRELLSTGGMGLVLMGEILRDIEALKGNLATQDLRSQEGVNNALTVQGEIRGMNRVIDRFFEIAERTE